LLAGLRAMGRPAGALKATKHAPANPLNRPHAGPTNLVRRIAGGAGGARRRCTGLSTPRTRCSGELRGGRCPPHVLASIDEGRWGDPRTFDARDFSPPGVDFRPRGKGAATVVYVRAKLSADQPRTTARRILRQSARTASVQRLRREGGGHLEVKPAAGGSAPSSRAQKNDRGGGCSSFGGGGKRKDGYRGIRGGFRAAVHGNSVDLRLVIPLGGTPQRCGQAGRRGTV